MSLRPPTFKEAVAFWFKLGCLSFGGPAGQIAMMHTEVVDKRRWIDEAKFLHALNFCMLLPGPEAQQLATYLGWRLHGVKGGIVAGVLFILPSAVLLWLLSWVFMAYGEVSWVKSIFLGLQPVVAAVIAAAVIRIGQRTLKNPLLYSVAALAFVGLFFLKLPFAVVLAGAALVGLIGHRVVPHLFQRSSGLPVAVMDSVPQRSSWWAPLGCLVAWWGPLLLVGVLLGWGSVWFQEGLFFSKAALITFGGAYAVLPYVMEQAVHQQGWLTSGQMMSGLALAETTPGPLIMVLQFVGFVGAWQNPGGYPPLLAGTLGAGVTTWATFLPSFFFVFTLAPHLERLERIKALSAVLTAITAAVVGVILNLSFKLGQHAFITPTGGLGVAAVLVAVACFICLWKGKMNVLGATGVGLLFGMVRAFMG